MRRSGRIGRAYWIGGGLILGLTSALAWSQGRDGAVRWLVIGTGILVWAGLGLVLWARSGRGETQDNLSERSPEDRVFEPPAAPHDDRPADGEVGMLPIIRVVSEPIAEGFEFRRFISLDAQQGEGSFKTFRIWGRRFPPLLGRVAIVSVFIGRDGKGWSNEELINAHRALRRAGAWIEREAIRWQVPVNIDLAETFFACVEDDADREVAIFRPDEWGGGIDLPDPDAERRILGILGRSAAEFGFQDLVDLLGRIGKRIEADQIVWLLHVRRAGKSIALPSDATGIPGVAVAVCYAREEDFEAPMAGPPFADPITFVHELMHLFGANDKYGVSLSSFPKGTVSERDVMVLGIEALSRLLVDPLTAVEIGWTASPTDRPTGPNRPLRSGPERGRPMAPQKKKRPKRP